jgi:IS5 family transposase
VKPRRSTSYRMRLPEIETHVIATPAAHPYMRARHKSEQLSARVLGRRRRIDNCRTADKARDPEMHQTKKGNQWYFGMKAHFGVDSRTKLIHAVVATPANVADSTVLLDLLHGKRPVCGVIRLTAVSGR